jgi:hypothetical protein
MTKTTIAPTTAPRLAHPVQRQRDFLVFLARESGFLVAGMTVPAGKVGVKAHTLTNVQTLVLEVAADMTA